MIIQTRNLRKIYRVDVEQIHALRGVNLDIEPNDFVAIMGSSGSGKSTLMNIIGCLDQPTDGRYILNGRDVSRMNAVELANVRNEQIGFVFQSFELLPRMTALKNVELPLIYAKGTWGSRGRKAKAALERVGLGNRMTHRPNQLSGGQKQRVAIARAILNNPAIRHHVAVRATARRGPDHHRRHARGRHRGPLSSRHSIVRRRGVLGRPLTGVGRAASGLSRRPSC